MQLSSCIPLLATNSLGVQCVVAGLDFRTQTAWLKALSAYSCVLVYYVFAPCTANNCAHVSVVIALQQCQHAV
jgi:hypothetical protein